jgi:hypothetical protein
MKINPLDKLQPSPSPVIDKAPKKPQDADFAEVLGKMVQTTRVANTVSSQPLQRVLEPNLAASQDSRAEAFKKVAVTLDALERYQKLLSDPQASLRSIQPAVNQLKAQVDTLEPILRHIPEGDALQQVVHETLIVVSKEITQFEQGDYVEV